MAVYSKARRPQPARLGVFLIAAIWFLIVVPLSAWAAPYAAYVVDARTGKVLHSRNSDARLHPASLTKMMTLYVAFEAIKRGEISLDSQVRISKHAASEPPSKLGLKAGQKIALRYLIRAAAVKSANDAATAIGEAISGSEAKFARRMNRTAKALGMTRTTFKNAHGLTENGHLSTARDMTTLGRHLFFDHPQYYNLFSRKSTNAGLREVANTNRRFLGNYRGADGIKTGYTRAAGFNLVASARRGNERIIATVFGGQSTASRNAKVAELLDLGFRRAPTNAKTRKPALPTYSEPLIVAGTTSKKRPAAGKTIRVAVAVKKSLRPRTRPVAEPVLLAKVETTPEVKTPAPKARPNTQAEDTLAAEIALAVAQANAEKSKAAVPVEIATVEPVQVALAEAPKDDIDAAVSTAVSFASLRPAARPKTYKRVETPVVVAEPEIVTRVSTSGGRHWGINIGRYTSRYKAEKVLLQTALAEMATLDGSLRKVVKRPKGFEANFLGMSRETADLACRRLQARNVSCNLVGPS